MANQNAPFGLRLLNKDGKQLSGRRYPKKSGTAIYDGDIVIQQSTGDVTVGTTSGKVLGVAMEYKAAADVTPILVCDDPEAIFEIQVSANIAAADVFQNANIVATTGDTSLKRSKQALDSATLTNVDDAQLKILGLSAIDDNAYGSYARVQVKINAHAFRNGVSGV